jgi:hypothetical protein
VQEQVRETRRKERGEMRQRRVGTEEEQDEEETEDEEDSFGEI